MVRIILLAASLIPSYLYAEQIPQRAVIEEIRGQVSDALVAFAEQEERCMESKKKLPAIALQEIGLTESELKDALEYHYLKNLVICSQSQADQLIIYSQMLSIASPKQEKQSSATSELILRDRIKLTKLRQEYFKISKIQRDLIESVKGMDRPIDLIATARMLGI